MDYTLTLKQKQFYQDHGYLILENFIPKTTCELLLNRSNYLIDTFDINQHQTFFSSVNQEHAKTNYFLESAEKIHFFFEEYAFKDKQLVADKYHAINKIGHALHDLDPVFNLFSRGHRIAKLCTDLELINPLLLQSMYIFKQPHIGGEVVCHQDSTYLHTHDNKLLGLWFALEDATVANGCLWAIPGGHKEGLKSKFIRNKDNSLSTEIYQKTQFATESAIKLEVPQGSVILLDGLLPHLSKSNTSSKSRHAYTLHLANASSSYLASNWLQRNHMPFMSF